MYRRPLLAILICVSVCAGLPVEQGDVPIKPVPYTELMGWSNVIELENPAMNVTIALDIGRIIRIQLKGSDNFLNLDEYWIGKVSDADLGSPWSNFGGDWVWPVAQSRWSKYTGSDWPPPPFINDESWAGRAWASADGSMTCRMSREFGEPLHIRLTRTIKLHAEKQRLTIHQRIERTESSEIPVTLWNLTQVGDAEMVIIPTDAASKFDDGFRSMAFGTPDYTFVDVCNGAIVYHPREGGEHKLCSDSQRQWIAAQKGEFAIVAKADPSLPDAKYPDDGCRIEMYSNFGLGYIEIETLSQEKDLQPGEFLENTYLLECYALETNMPPCDVVKQIRTRLGEITPE